MSACALVVSTEFVGAELQLCVGGVVLLSRCIGIYECGCVHMGVSHFGRCSVHICVFTCECICG